MELNELQTWGAVGAAGAGGVGLLIYAISTLLKTIVSSYGGVIATLHDENNRQQSQLNEQGQKIVALQTALAEARKATADKLEVLKESHIETASEIAELKRAVSNGK